MVQFLELILSSIAGFLIGILWYSQLGFGKTWMKEMKVDVKNLKIDKKEMSFSMILGFIKTIIFAFVLILMIEYTGFKTAQEFFKLGFFVWIGFIATVILDSVLWEKKSKKLYFINSIYYLVVIFVMLIIIYSL